MPIRVLRSIYKGCTPRSCWVQPMILSWCVATIEIRKEPLLAPNRLLIYKVFVSLQCYSSKRITNTELTKTPHRINQNETLTLSPTCPTRSGLRTCTNALLGKYDDDHRQHKNTARHHHPLSQLPNREGKRIHLQKHRQFQHSHQQKPSSQSH